MALTRKMLKAMGIEEDKIEQIIEAHTETVDGLKADVAKYKAEADTLPDLQQQLDAAKSDSSESWKVKYNAVKEEFDSYKTAQTEKETKAAKENAYRGLLKSAGVSERRIDSVLKVSDLSGLELAEDGKFKDETSITDDIKTEWADFIVQSSTNGAAVSTPASNGKSMTKDEIMQIKDRGERRAAIAANMDLFRKG